MIIWCYTPPQNENRRNFLMTTASSRLRTVDMAYIALFAVLMAV